MLSGVKTKVRDEEHFSVGTCSEKGSKIGSLVGELNNVICYSSFSNLAQNGNMDCLWLLTF